MSFDKYEAISFALEPEPFLSIQKQTDFPFGSGHVVSLAESVEHLCEIYVVISLITSPGNWWHSLLEILKSSHASFLEKVITSRKYRREFNEKQIDKISMNQHQSFVAQTIRRLRIEFAFLIVLKVQPVKISSELLIFKHLHFNEFFFWDQFSFKDQSRRPKAGWTFRSLARNDSIIIRMLNTRVVSRISKLGHFHVSSHISPPAALITCCVCLLLFSPPANRCQRISVSAKLAVENLSFSSSFGWLFPTTWYRPHWEVKA